LQRDSFSVVFSCGDEAGWGFVVAAIASVQASLFTHCLVLSVNSIVGIQRGLA